MLAALRHVIIHEFELSLQGQRPCGIAAAFA
jgi:hypothetical protein